MKRSTLILLAVAALLGIGVYYFEYKDAKPRDEKPDESKAAFTFKSEDIQELGITRNGQTVRIERKDDKWLLTQPVNAQADQSAVNLLINSITEAKIERSISASQEDIKSFKLDQPIIILEVKLKNGQQHRIRLGDKDFSGSSIYSQIDDSKDVALMNSSVFTSSDKSINELRDLTIVELSQDDVTYIKIDDEKNNLELTKDNEKWRIKNPFEAEASDLDVSSFLSSITSSKATEIASETEKDLAKYGLDKPKVKFNAKLKDGSERTLIIGVKDNDTYYAKKSDHPQIYKIDAEIYSKFTKKPTELMDKQIVKLNQEELTKLTIKNKNQTLVVEKGAEGKWLYKEPADKKDKEFPFTKIIDPLLSAIATEIMSNISSITALKSASEAELELIGKDNKTIKIKISKAEGDHVYVRIDDKSFAYKIEKQSIQDLISGNI
jgi:hypothetical protein